MEEKIKEEVLEEVEEELDADDGNNTDNSTEIKDNPTELKDPFVCPNDEFLRSIWPIPNKGLQNLKKYTSELAEKGGIKDRTPIQDFGVDTPKFTCPACKTTLTKGTSFWATSSFIGNIHLDKKPRLLLCKKCTAAYYKKLLEHHSGNHMRAMLHFCYDFDFYYDKYLLEKLITYGYDNNPETPFPDSYLKIINDVGKQNPYKGKTFFQQLGYDTVDQIMTGDYDYAARKQEIEKEREKQIEEQLTQEDRVHRSKIIATYLYDPFEGYGVADRIQMYRDLYLMIDDGLAEDLPRQKAALEIVRSYGQLAQFNDTLQQLIDQGDTTKEAAENIAKWTQICSNKSSIITAQAKENNFSARYAGAAGKGSGTLSGIQKELTEGYDDEIVTNYFDIKTSSSIRHIADISAESMFAQLELNENDYTEMIKEQANEIKRLTAEKDKAEEELRLIRAKLTKGRLLRELKKEFQEKGIEDDEIDMILEDEYTVPGQVGDPENGEE